MTVQERKQSIAERLAELEKEIQELQSKPNHEFGEYGEPYINKDGKLLIRVFGIPVPGQDPYFRIHRSHLEWFLEHHEKIAKSLKLLLS
jgi:hypothetical protein